jgi:formamidopyrimidine-DNA glycosylase
VPELPEVEYARRQLHRAMHGARIERVLARRPDLRYPLGDDFVRRLERRQIRAVRRRAKYLLVDLSSGDVLLMHLGMTGSFRVVRQGPEEEALAHDHVVFEMSSGRAVVFNDPRRFGFMRVLSADEAAAHPALAVLGAEPLEDAFTADVLAAALRRRKTSLKAALLDQQVVAGLGNIYACEALHRARLAPKRRASTIVDRTGRPTPAAVALVEAIKKVLGAAVANEHRMYGEDRFRVYGREGQPCSRRRCGGTIKRIVQGGRSTFYCPVCQR